MLKLTNRMLQRASSEECRLLGYLQTPAHTGFLLTDFSTLKMEAILFSEASVYARSTRRHIPEDGILHSHRRANLKSYMAFLEVYSFSDGQKVARSGTLGLITAFVQYPEPLQSSPRRHINSLRPFQ
jgi:hypothetical protein